MFDFLSGKEAIIVAGFAGGLSKVLVTGAKHILEVSRHVVVGVLSSFYFTMPVSNYFGATDDSVVGAIGFAMGIIGLSVVEALIKVSEKGHIVELFNGYLKSRYGNVSRGTGGSYDGDSK